MARLQTLVSLVLMGAAPKVFGQTAMTNESETAPVIQMDAGSFHTVVIIKDSGTNLVKDWGANGKGQLGLNDTKDRGDPDGDVGDLLPVVNVGNGFQATQVTAGLRHTAAILDDNSVRAWGYNAKGQLGVGTSESVGDDWAEMGDNLRVTDLGDSNPVVISAGGWHTCAIMEGNQLKCWGYNQWGELGLEDKEDRGDQPGEMGNDLPFVDLGDGVEVVAIALGDWHTCAILDDGDVVCFGKNSSGQLGLGDTSHRGDDEGEMGFNLPRVYLGDKKAASIACGEEHTCAILEDGELRCWGLGFYGQLGQGNAFDVGDQGGDMQGLVGIDLGTDRIAVQVAAGGNHTCALLDNGEVKCWGLNEFGQLGQGDTTNRGDDPDEMGNFLDPIAFKTGWEIQSLSVGYDHSCALVDPDDAATSVLCWGGNYNGQLGIGLTETKNIGDEPGEMGEELVLAVLEGTIGESDEKFYEQIWFYIVVAAGAVLCLCFCVLAIRSHSDSSGASIRGRSRKGAGSPAVEEGAPKAVPPPGAPFGYAVGGTGSEEEPPESIEIEEADDAKTAAGSPNAEAAAQANKTGRAEP